MNSNNKGALVQCCTLEVDAEGGIRIPLRLLRELSTGVGDYVMFVQYGECLKLVPSPKGSKR